MPDHPGEIEPLRQLAEDMAVSHGMTLAEASAVIGRMVTETAKPLSATAVPIGRWAAWRIRLWMRLGRKRRAQAIILHHLNPDYPGSRDGAS